LRGDRLHEPYYQVHTKLRNRAPGQKNAAPVRRRLHKTSLENLATDMPLIEWAHAREAQVMRAARAAGKD